MHKLCDVYSDGSEVFFLLGLTGWDTLFGNRLQVVLVKRIKSAYIEFSIYFARNSELIFTYDQSFLTSGSSIKCTTSNIFIKISRGYNKRD